MKLSIITPSLARPSLRDCCHSVDIQLGAEWEHIIAFDCAEADLDSDLMFSLAHPCRQFLSTGRRYGHYGNAARRLAWEKATGDFVLHLDDDDRLYRPDALADICHALLLDHLPDWALFPIHRHGSPFLLLPPGMCRTDTANMVIRRDLACWPDTEIREADGLLADHLSSHYAYSAFPDMQPIVLKERSSNGQ